MMSLNRENRTTNKKAWYTKAADAIKRGIEHMITSVIRTWNGAQKETRHWLAILSAAGVLLLIAVITLSVRLHGMAEELETAQAMSKSLQVELELAKESAETDLPQNGQNGSQGAMAPISTSAPTPTTAPTPTVVEDKHIVCVDAGHGDWDGGAVLKVNGKDERVEKIDNLWMSTLFKEALEAYDVEVVMTRETDEFLELSERTAIANAIGADALISFHRNSFAVDGVLQLNEINGVEIWVHNSKPEGAVTLATSLLDSVTEVGGMRNRGVKYGTMAGSNENYAINREANMTSMIVELGFVTSAADNAAYDEYGQAYAEAMAKVVYEWLEDQES